MTVNSELVLHYKRGERAADEAVKRRLKEEYEELISQDRLEEARNVLAAYDRATIRLQTIF